MSKSGKKKSVVPPGGGERQGKEEQWDLVSPQLSSLLQGKGKSSKTIMIALHENSYSKLLVTYYHK